MNKIEGVYTALVTPFVNGAVDYESLRQLVKFQTSAGIAGCVINGTTGEFPTTTADERRRIFELVREQAGNNFRIIAGTGSYSTKKTIEHTQTSQSWGVDAAMIITPYYVKPPQRGLIAHFREVAQNCDLPIVIYNCPTRTGVSLTVESIIALQAEKNIVAIKEASGDISFGGEIIKRCGDKISVLSGDDKTWMQLVQAGGNGVISVLSNLIPIKMGLLYRYLTSSNSEEQKRAVSEYERYGELANLLACESNPIPVKAALKLMGFIASDEMRLPLVELSKDNLDLMREELRYLGIIK